MSFHASLAAAPALLPLPLLVRPVFSAAAGRARRMPRVRVGYADTAPATPPRTLLASANDEGLLVRRRRLGRRGQRRRDQGAAGFERRLKRGKCFEVPGPGVGGLTSLSTEPAGSPRVPSVEASRW